MEDCPQQIPVRSEGRSGVLGRVHRRVKLKSAAGETSPTSRLTLESPFLFSDRGLVVFVRGEDFVTLRSPKQQELKERGARCVEAQEVSVLGRILTFRDWRSSLEGDTSHSDILAQAWDSK